MKTEAELIEAMRAISDEASKSGFTFCAAIAPMRTQITTIYCGESLKLVGLTEVIKANVFENNLMHQTLTPRK